MGAGMGRITRRGLVMATFATAARAQQATMQLAAAGPGSAFLAFAEAIAPMVDRRVRIKLEPVRTAGSNENARLVSAGQVPFALLNMGPGADAWHGRGPFSAGRLRGMRAVAPMYETPFAALALRRSGITTLRSLDGKRVGVGPAGGPGEVYFAGLQEAIGMRGAKVVTGTPAELGAAVLRGDVDAFWYGSGLPAPPFADVARRAEAVVIGFQPDEAAAFRAKFPYFAPYEIPALTYAGQDAPVASLAVWNFMVAHEAVPDDAVGRLAQALIEGADEIAGTFPAAAAMRAMNLDANRVLPWHPGAAAYYRSAGVTLPPVPSD